MFRSDNVLGAIPQVMRALSAAAEGRPMPYGDDELDRALTRALAERFECDLEIFAVATGTAANALALSCICPPWGAIYCHPEAHVNCDECGAVEEATAGAKLVAVEGADGKLEPAALRRAMQGAGNVHRVQPAAVSISQTTECGTLYRPAELAALCDFAHTHDLLVHLDGARLANALVSLDCSLAATTWQAGVDVASLGFTKNGALCAELVVVFEARRFPQLAFKRKRAGHLLSKSWFVAAQVLALLEDDRWLHQARHANAMASRLASGLLARGRELVWPTQANEVFVRLRAAERQQLRDAGHVFYDWPSGDDIARLVCSLRTSPDEVDTFLASVDRVHSA